MITIALESVCQSKIEGMIREMGILLLTRAPQHLSFPSVPASCRFMCMVWLLMKQLNRHFRVKKVVNDDRGFYVVNCPQKPLDVHR